MLMFSGRMEIFMPEIKNEEIMSHNAYLKDRKHLELTGVLDVEKFDESSVVLYTELGKLSIKGEALNITKLEITELEGEVMIEGNINSLEYDKSKNKNKNRSFISKLLG